jgi:chromosome segregation ATPase
VAHGNSANGVCAASNADKVAPVPPAIIEEIKALATETTKGVTEVKRYVEAVKADVSRDIGMLEAVIIRKCEVTMSKMMNDKINIALDTHRNGTKEALSAVREELMLEIGKQTQSASAAGVNDPAVLDAIQRQIDELKSTIKVIRNEVATSSNSSSTFITHKIDTLKAEMLRQVDSVRESLLNTASGARQDVSALRKDISMVQESQVQAAASITALKNELTEEREAATSALHAMTEPDDALERMFTDAAGSSSKRTDLPNAASAAASSRRKVGGASGSKRESRQKPT